MRWTGDGAFLPQVWTVAVKELTVLFRIPAVVIFTLCVPLFVYTPALVGTALFDLWQEHTTEYRIGVGDDQQSREIQAFFTLVREPGRLSLQTAGDGLAQLQDNSIDLWARSDDGKVKLYYVTGKERSRDAMEYVKLQLQREKTRVLVKTLKNFDAREGCPFQIKFLDINETEHASQMTQVLGFVVRLVIVGLSFLVLLEARISTTYPALTVLASEREKQTILTTLSLPVSHARLLTGKCLAALMVAFFPILWNTITLIVVLLFLSHTYSISQSTIADFISLGARAAPLIVPAVVLDNWLSTIFYFIACCISRSIYETNVLMFFGSSFLLLILLVPLLPSIELNMVTALIPFVNLPLVIRDVVLSDPDPLAIVVAFAQSVLLIILGTRLVAMLFASEAFQSADRSPLLYHILSRTARKTG